MTTTDDFDLTVEPAIYYTDPWRKPSIPRQLRESLARQRAQGCGFDLAWRQALGHLSHDHDHSSRHQWVALLHEDSYRELWRAAYNREPLSVLLACNLLRRVFDDAQARDAERRGRPDRRPGRPPRHLA